MDPVEFVRKWSDSRLRERQGSQSHFIDLCALLGVPSPTDADQLGDRYCFERGAEKVGGGDGWADVWRKGCFGWEYKGKHANLAAALRQLQAYALNLENPPYLVVCDMERIEVHTNWTNTVSRRIEFTLEGLLDPAQRELLRQVLDGSERLKPTITTQDLTAKVAARFGELGKRLQDRKEEPRAVAHFLNRLVFCMFAEDAGLLPEKLFSRTVRATQGRPAAAQAQLSDLFGKMAQPGDTFFGADLIRWFNGGLFDDGSTLLLEPADLKLIADTAEEHDWSQIDPSIFGSMFEQALKATRERPALGAHYTDREKILKIVEPVIVRPLTAEWEAVHAEAIALAAEAAKGEDDRRAVFEAAAEALKVDPAAARAGEAKRRTALTQIARRRDAALGAAKAKVQAWLDRLVAFRVLDPACGSGNFLYVALHALLDLEQRAILDAERLGLAGFVPRVGLECVRGIEIERYAAELARLTLWIGYLQWVRKRGGRALSEPILSTLDQIENRDAVLNADGTEAQWPAVDVIIGNPPFLGDKKMIRDLGEGYVERLRAAYQGRVPGGADFVCYWIAKGWETVQRDTETRIGLVTTNSVRSGASRKLLDSISAAGLLAEAWSDEPWVLEGAAIRVSMIAFGQGFRERRLNGVEVTKINSDLTSSAVDLTLRSELVQNKNSCFVGVILNGHFEIDESMAREWLVAPRNVNGRSNQDVIRPTLNGDDFNGERPAKWIIDFGTGMTERDASFYEKPYDYLRAVVEPYRRRTDALGNFVVRSSQEREIWWRHARPRPAMRKAMRGLIQYIATPMVSSYRTFGFLPVSVLPDQKLVAFAREDFTFFGVLHSRYHDNWTRWTCSWIGAGNDITYSVQSTYLTFPFPEGLTPNIPAADYADDPRAVAIAEAARRLNELREAWLNPPDLVVRTPEVVPGYPDRLLPKDEDAARELKKRTLTNLYNARPTWLDMAHRDLDAAVAAAYGWPSGLSDEAVLERLFALNQGRAAENRR